MFYFTRYIYSNIPASSLTMIEDEDTRRVNEAEFDEDTRRVNEAKFSNAGTPATSEPATSCTSGQTAPLSPKKAVSGKERFKVLDVSGLTKSVVINCPPPLVPPPPPPPPLDE